MDKNKIKNDTNNNENLENCTEIHLDTLDGAKKHYSYNDKLKNIFDSLNNRSSLNGNGATNHALWSILYSVGKDGKPFFSVPKIKVVNFNDENNRDQVIGTRKLILIETSTGIRAYGTNKGIYDVAQIEFTRVYPATNNHELLYKNSGNAEKNTQAFQGSPIGSTTLQSTAFLLCESNPVSATAGALYTLIGALEGNKKANDLRSVSNDRTDVDMQIDKHRNEQGVILQQGNTISAVWY